MGGSARGRARRLIVLDASAALALLLDRPSSRRAAQLLGADRTAAPVHFDLEVFSAVRRFVRLGEIGPVDGAEVIRRTALLPVDRHPLIPLLPVAYEVRDRFGAADAFYAVLAHALRATLLTADARLARAAEGYVPVTFVDP